MRAGRGACATVVVGSGGDGNRDAVLSALSEESSPPLSPVAASLLAVGSPLKQLPFHLDKLITDPPSPVSPPPSLQQRRATTKTANARGRRERRR